jgi:hypothetical protein
VAAGAAGDVAWGAAVGVVAGVQALKTILMAVSEEMSRNNKRLDFIFPPEYGAYELKN